MGSCKVLVLNKSELFFRIVDLRLSSKTFIAMKVEMITFLNILNFSLYTMKKPLSVRLACG